MGARVVAALSCMDGRAVQPVIEWMERSYRAIVVDVVTAPGLAGLLVEGGPAYVRAATELAVRDHGAVAVAVAGHAECAAHAVSEATHKNHVQAAMEEVMSWGLGVPVIGLWVDEKRVARRLSTLEPDA